MRTTLVEIASFNESCLLALKATELIAFPNPLYIKAKINFKTIETPKIINAQIENVALLSPLIKEVIEL